MFISCIAMTEHFDHRTIICGTEPELLGLAAQKVFFSGATLFGIAEAAGLEWGAVLDHGIEDAGQLVGGRLTAPRLEYVLSIQSLKEPLSRERARV